jgi:subtilisin-like proprotein convertase family protein
MRTKIVRYIGSSLALLAAATFFFSSFVTPHTKAVPGEGSKGDKTTGAAAAPTTTFTNSTPIAINDNDIGTPYPSNINVTGLVGPVQSVKVTLNGYSHSFPDDMAMVLKGPTGAALLIQDGAGDDPDMNNVTYTIADTGATVLPNSTAWTAGTYKPTTYYAGDSFPAPGPGTTYGSPGPTGGGTATFASTFNGTSPNGTWSLYVVDFVIADDGEIAGGWTLEITATTGDPFDSVVDFNGDGITDWGIVRSIGGQMNWILQANNPAALTTYQPWGQFATDFPVPEDYDGDNKADIAVWRDTEHAFYILQSGSNTFRGELFGLSGDDPTVVGDYDGNGTADLAVTRRTGGLLYWFYRPVPNGPIFTRQWGLDTDFAAPGDYDGDGKGDFVVQRGKGIQAAFYSNFGADAPGVLSRRTTFGRPSDIIAPGDYDGDGKTDIAIVREAGANLEWYYEPSSAPGTFLGGAWGTVATDFITQGDYDGDGKTDFAVWRTNPDPTQNFFLVRKSSDGTLLSHEWGEQNDFPVATFNTH